MPSVHYGRIYLINPPAQGRFPSCIGQCAVKGGELAQMSLSPKMEDRCQLGRNLTASKSEKEQVGIRSNGRARQVAGRPTWRRL